MICQNKNNVEHTVDEAQMIAEHILNKIRFEEKRREIRRDDKRIFDFYDALIKSYNYFFERKIRTVSAISPGLLYEVMKSVERERLTFFKLRYRIDIIDDLKDAQKEKLDDANVKPESTGDDFIAVGAERE